MGRIYITNDAVKVLHDLASNRSEKEIKIESDRMYNALKVNLQDVMNGKDDIRVMRVVDRKIGKTYSLIRLAIEYNLPIVPHKNLKRIYKEQAQYEFGKEIKVIPISKGGRAKERYDIVLKDEGVSVQEVIDFFWPWDVQIVGLSSIYERGQW